MKKKREMIILITTELVLFGIFCIVGVFTKSWFDIGGKVQVVISFIVPLIFVVMFLITPLVMLKIFAKNKG